MEPEALRKVSPHPSRDGANTARRKELMATWQRARGAIEQAMVHNPNGFDPEQLAQLRMLEMRAWKNLQNAEAVSALGTLGKA